MIYYHFGSKEGLFAAVLEDVYAGMRRIEGALQLADLTPREAVRQLVHVTFDCHAKYPDWVRLISVANIHEARHTWRVIFGRDLEAADDAPLQRAMLVEAVPRYPQPDAGSPA